jgi:DNA-binding CsgD family transcriptional regulator
MSVADYRRSATITHHYDGPVLQEGIKSILAVPVVVEGRSRAVLYGAYRAAAPIGDRTADLMIASARVLDVLAQVALGCTNAEAANRLWLKPETVKSYLRSATAKLGAHIRHEAVAKARRARLLP